MNLCSYNHDEICYEDGDCPLCQAQETIKALGTTVSGLNEQIEELKTEINSLTENQGEE